MWLIALSQVRPYVGLAAWWRPDFRARRGRFAVRLRAFRSLSFGAVACALAWRRLYGDWSGQRSPPLSTALSRRGSGEPAFERPSISWRGPPLAQALAGQIDAIGVVNDAVEDGVGERGNADQVMPAVHGNLAGDDERAFVVAILDDFEQIARLVGRERFGSPIIQDEQFDAREGPQEPGVARIPMGDGQIGEEPGGAGVENGHVFSARLLAEGAGEPALAQAARPGHEQIATLGDPVTSGELEEERAVEPAGALIVDVLDAGRMTQLSDPGARFELLLSAQRQLVFEQQTEPFGMIEAARFMFVFEFLEPFGQAVEAEGVQLVERGMSEHGISSQW